MYEDNIIDSVNEANSDLFLSKEGREYLYKTGNWALFFAVLGFIGLAFNVLIAVVFISMKSIMPADIPNAAMLGNIYPAMGIFTLIITAIFAYPVVKLFQFSSTAKTAARGQDSAVLTRSLSNLHAYFKWFGIMIIVSIALYFIGVFIMVGTIAQSSGGF